MGYRGEVPAEDCALEGCDAVGDAVPLRLIDGRAEGDNGGDERWGAVPGGIVQGPCVDVIPRDTNVVVDVEECVRGTKDGAEADGAVEDDAALEVTVLSAAEEKRGEEVREGGVCAREDAEVASRKGFRDFENHFVRNSCERHDGGDDIDCVDCVDGIVGVVIVRQRVQIEP